MRSAISLIWLISFFLLGNREPQEAIYARHMGGQALQTHLFLNLAWPAGCVLAKLSREYTRFSSRGGCARLERDGFVEFATRRANMYTLFAG